MEWPYPLPEAFVAFSEVLAVAMGLAVGGMGGWHWYLVSVWSFFLFSFIFSYWTKREKRTGYRGCNVDCRYSTMDLISDYFVHSKR